MSDFFDNHDATDETCRHIVQGETPHALEARRLVNSLWTRTAAFLDPKLPRRAQFQFHQSFWEMYLAAAFLDLGLPVRPRNKRRFASKGPDVQIADVEAWIEAVALTPGEGIDAVAPAEL